MPSEHEQKMVNLTHQMRHNQADLQSFLSDLDSWESDIKKKEENLLNGEAAKNETLPPVRNTIHKKKLKKKKKQKVVDPDKQKKKMSGFDFQSWDKFDVDKAIEEIDSEKKKETSSSEYETDEEWEMERRIHLAGQEKEKGNKFLKDGDYDRAVEAYSRGMDFDATNALLPANRAMALLKQQKFAAAELDCTTSISIDPLYVKAYLRRASARANLNKTKEAIEDYNRVLDFEPTNKMAKSELERLQKEKERDEKDVIPSTLTEDERGIVKAIYKSPEERSKVPLKRVTIEEIGIETIKRHQHPLTEQSELTKKITEKESKNFENLLANSLAPSPTEVSSEKTATESLVANHQIKSVNAESPPEKDTAVSENYGNKSIVNTADTDMKISNHQSEIVGKDEPSNNREEKRVPNIPTSSFQFQTDFKLLKNDPEAFYQYFKVIPPAQYPKLFGQCLDADILKAIIKVLLGHRGQRDEMNGYEVLEGLTHVKRFSMTAMFLNRKEKQDARELMEKISSDKLCSSEEFSSLKQKYDL